MIIRGYFNGSINMDTRACVFLPCGASVYIWVCVGQFDLMWLSMHMLLLFFCFGDFSLSLYYAM